MSSPASISDGEIVENGTDSPKAAPLHQSGGSSGVDRQRRNRARSRSPDYDDSRRDRRSRSPRGYKRSVDDLDARGPDPRRFRVHYEDERRRFTYDDPPRPPSREQDRSRPRPGYPPDGGRLPDRGSPPRERDRYRDDREAYPSKRRDRGHRDRGKPDARRFSGQINGDHSATTKYIAHGSRGDDSTPKRAVSKATESLKSVAKSDKGATDDRIHNAAKGESASKLRDTVDQAPATAVDIDFDAARPVDETVEIERRRRRREEILRKSRASTPMIQTLHVSDRPSSTPLSRISTPKQDGETPLSAGSPALSTQEVVSPGLDLANDEALINQHGEVKSNDEDGPSAADYDPTIDMQEDERREELRHGNVGLHGEDRHPSQTELLPEEPIKPTSGNDEDFDMFAQDFDEEKFAPTAPIKNEVAAEVDKTVKPSDNAILEGDDKDGYYKIRPGEILGGRYQVQSTLGKGMFSGVARANDIITKKFAAIKIMRNNDALRKGGFTEIAILQKLNDADPENKKHIVRFERSFEYKGHLCMAFENLSLNLREVLKKFGNNVGINLNATRAYAYQIFLALGHMRKCSIIHADLKPDNILVNENRSVLKICDLGTAIDRSDAATAHTEITPYLVSRFYRAPEIILGLPYDYAIDMWSIGCTLYELYTGKILFTGDSNNQMLRTIMEIRGKLSPKLYRRGQLAQMHFDDAGSFISVERDKALGKTAVRTLAAVKPTRDLRTRLLAASGGMTDAETRELNHLVDLLERCLALNPDKRITPSEALKHPFFTQRVHASSR